MTGADGIHVPVVAVVRGTVQGVGFRWWTRRLLDRLGLDGTAENLADGTVRVTARGPRTDVERLVEELRGGATPGRVTGVDVTGLDDPDVTDDAPLGRSLPRLRDRAAHDVVVVGAGPAGLSAALVLGRSRRDVLVVDDGQPRNAVASHVHGYLGHDGTPPATLLALGREECERYGVRFRAGRVTHLRPGDGVVEVSVETSPETSLETSTAGGTPLTARRVLVATGLRDELPDVPGLAARWGRDVLHCPYCHGWEHRDSTLAVLVTAPEEVSRALTVRQWSPAVSVVLHGLGVDALDERTTTRLAATGVRVHEGPATGLEVAEDRLTGLRLAGDRVVACDAVLVQPRLVARDELLRDVGVEALAGEFGHVVVTDETGATGVPGVWATGNVAEPQGQVVTAAADGHRAAVAIDHDLMTEDVDTAVDAAVDTAVDIAASTTSGTAVDANP